MRVILQPKDVEEAILTWIKDRVEMENPFVADRSLLTEIVVKEVPRP